ncbi:uncharacterized protein LOC114527011 [Dendronephthya gigantea]|uniref:uncharacterized protein LOC114527011 n=1 Tax=Dendronephthya gigantea TaxID=151771 RepID=UPI00106B4892|nr:uncharacterized protein LOC114527011 [Dendronephthya gigantea]
MSTFLNLRSYLAILVFFLGFSEATLARLKISMKKGVESETQFSRTKRSTGACSNYCEIDPKTIAYDGNPKPWDRPPAVTFVSNDVTQGMKKALKARVPGLGKTTIKDVLDKLKEGGCLCIPFGGSVRDQFLGRKTLDIDADSPCDANKIVEICKKHWEDKYCKGPPEWAKLKIVHIGDKEGDGEDIDLANWNNSFFGNLTNLEYTTNSLAYYDDAVANRGVVIDFTASGVNDTCNKLIRIPVPRDQWKDWYQGDAWKIFRYWKLLAKGYEAESNELPSFIKNKTKELLQTEYGIKVFRITFFTYILSGEYNDTLKIATVPYPTCSSIAHLKQYYPLFKDVLGEYWENVAKPLLDEIKIECSTSTIVGSSDNTNLSLILIAICALIQCAVWQGASC